LKRGYLSEYFKGVAAKHLSAVEADTLRSNQHEFNGVRELVQILGEPDGKVLFPAKFLYLTDDDDTPIVETGSLTWYDARQKAREERGIMRWENRLYFPTNLVTQNLSEGDLLIVTRNTDDSLLAIVAEKSSTVENQLLWLFGFTDLGHPGFSIRGELESEQDRIAFTSRLILENIGIVVETEEGAWLDKIFAKFGKVFPTTKEFSEFARTTIQADIRDDQDNVLLAWMDREEILFRTLEKHLIADRLQKGFGNDVDEFLKYSLSVQNRRKSRVGFALENHLEAMFKACGIRYSRGAYTENKAKPDFLFPGIQEYRNPAFDAINLTMLGVKSTCKDRWRQVLSEADRIDRKHLLTLEPAISPNQTTEMQSKLLQLVIPKPLHVTYLPTQKEWLMSISDFVTLISERQKN
jgi:hypothetical protein